MARIYRSGMAVVVAVCGLTMCKSPLAGAAEPAGFTTRPVSLALRPKLGQFFVATGDLGDCFDGFLHGEVGLKATFNHFGLEWSMGCMGSNSYNSRLRKLSPKAISGIIKVTGTFELNPMAGVPERTDRMSAFGLKNANAYVGAGMGYYPTKLEFDAINDDEYFDGGGFHAVLGVEYFFHAHTGVFGEFQYTHLSYVFDKNMGDGNMHGFSLLLGLSFKF